MKRLPEAVLRNAARLFWDVDLAALDPEVHQDFILGRVLSQGDWASVRAVREATGDEVLREFLARAPHRLDSRTRRFFEVVLFRGDRPCTTKPSRPTSRALFVP